MPLGPKRLKGSQIRMIEEWIAAGAYAAGFVAPLFPPEDLANARWDDIEARAARCIRAVNSP